MMLKILVILLISVIPISAFADIPITISEEIQKVNFDGKWSWEREWKASSTTELKTDEGIIYIKSAHHDNYLYILLDVIPDKTFSKGMDKGVICFENRNTDQEIQKNYCFSSALNVSTGKTFQSGAVSVWNSNYKLIKNPEGFVGIGGISDENDRYSKIPHTTYEFKIPIDFLGRSNVYGFYVYVLDHDSKNVYTWPANILDENEKIPSTDKWGTIYSPDKTLPEFHLGIVLLIGLVPIILISNFRKILLIRV